MCNFRFDADTAPQVCVTRAPFNVVFGTFQLSEAPLSLLKRIYIYIRKYGVRTSRHRKLPQRGIEVDYWDRKSFQRDGTVFICFLNNTRMEKHVSAGWGRCIRVPVQGRCGRLDGLKRRLK